MGIADINTRAYENVKNTWNGRGIWNKRWGILPGMLWKQEEPLEEIADHLIPTPGNPLDSLQIVRRGRRERRTVSNLITIITITCEALVQGFEGMCDDWFPRIFEQMHRLLPQPKMSK
jgi:hypothetical protein